MRVWCRWCRCRRLRWSGGDLGDAVGAEVGDEDLAAVGFEREVDGGLADVEQGEEVVGGGGRGPVWRARSRARRRARWP